MQITKNRQQLPKFSEKQKQAIELLAHTKLKVDIIRQAIVEIRNPPKQPSEQEHLYVTVHSSIKRIAVKMVRLIGLNPQHVTLDPDKKIQNDDFLAKKIEKQLLDKFNKEPTEKLKNLSVEEFKKVPALLEVIYNFFESKNKKTLSQKNERTGKDFKADKIYITDRNGKTKIITQGW